MEYGEVLEWTIRLVLKTSKGHMLFVGSNPTLSAFVRQSFSDDDLRHRIILMSKAGSILDGVKRLLNSKFFVHCIFLFLFGVFLFIGIHIFCDYGVGIDEYSQIALGKVNYERVFEGRTGPLAASFDRYYGPAFETFLYEASPLVRRVFGVGVIDSRHLLEFLFFAGSAFAFYVLLWQMTGSAWYGLLGSLLLVCSPRMFGQSFFNSKDMGFLSIGIYLLLSLWYFLDWSRLSLLIYGVLSGFALAIRPQAVMFIVGGLMAIFLLSKKTSAYRFRRALLYLGITGVAVLLFYPVFWTHPLSGFGGFIARMAEPIGVPTYFFGKFYISPEIPWYHLIVWVALTSPISIVIASVFGLILFLRGGEKNTKLRTMCAVMAWIVLGTFVLAVVLRARTYDGWRHIYYVYPPLIGFSVYAVHRFFKNQKRLVAYFFILLFLVDGVGTVRFMVQNHPNEYVYFNMLAGSYPSAKSNFDFDYWGVSLRQDFSFLLSLPRADRRVYVEEASMFPYVQYDMAPALFRHGFTMVSDVSKADIYVTVERDNKLLPPARFHKVYSVSVDSADLSAVYMLH